MASEVKSDEENDNKGSMWSLDQKLDQPMDEEAGRLRNMYREKKISALLLLRLAYQRLGVVYGDLGTSPLYVFYNTFPNGVQHKEDVIGALSLIIYSLTLVPLLKYVFIVFKSKWKWRRSTINERPFAAKTKRWLEEKGYIKNVILILILVGTCMMIGDGILTQAISVLSASGGIKVNHPHLSSGVVVVVAVVILVGLFSLQHYGTDRVGWLFAPVVLLWFLLIGGTEALFADLGHFPVSSVHIVFALFVFPCLLLAYSGQAAYLMNNLNHSQDVFYRSIPVFAVAIAAAIVASQATITATFSIINQALTHGCFPRVKVVHTSKRCLGQIYIPDINWILMILCIAVTAGFKDQNQIGNAYGTAVVIVFLVTTLLMILIMILVLALPLDSCPYFHWLIIDCGMHILLCCTLQSRSRWMGSPCNCCSISYCYACLALWYSETL